MDAQPILAAEKPNYGEIATRLKDGTIIPFFGAGASVSCGFPSGKKLAETLVKASKFPDEIGRDDLARVASYFFATSDLITVRRALREAMDFDAKPGVLHECLADPFFRKTKLFVTTNYDDLVERALSEKGREPWVVVDRGVPGMVLLRDGKEPWKEAKSKTLRARIADSERPIVLKIHGTLDRQNAGNDSYLISEEHYVEYLGRPAGAQIPQMLAVDMREKSFLFLGYGLNDWNVRVLMRKLAETRPRNDKIDSWAISRTPSLAARALWKKQDVLVYAVDLANFVDELRAVL